MGAGWRNGGGLGEARGWFGVGAGDGGRGGAWRPVDVASWVGGTLWAGDCDMVGGV